MLNTKGRQDSDKRRSLERKSAAMDAFILKRKHMIETDDYTGVANLMIGLGTNHKAAWKYVGSAAAKRGHTDQAREFFGRAGMTEDAIGAHLKELL